MNTVPIVECVLPSLFFTCNNGHCVGCRRDGEIERQISKHIWAGFNSQSKELFRVLPSLFFSYNNGHCVGCRRDGECERQISKHIWAGLNSQSKELFRVLPSLFLTYNNGLWVYSKMGMESERQISNTYGQAQTLRLKNDSVFCILFSSLTTMGSVSATGGKGNFDMKSPNLPHVTKKRHFRFFIPKQKMHIIF